MSRLAARGFLALLVVAAMGSRTIVSTAGARAVLVDRVVAVVDDEVVTLHDLEERAVPFQKSLDPAAKDHASQRAEMLRTVLTRMVDEKLVAKEACHAHVAVGPAEVDSAVHAIAAENHLTDDELVLAAKQQGMTLASYRDELRRQLLEAKLLQLTILRNPDPLRPDSKASAEAQAAWLQKKRDRMIADLKSHAYVDVRL